MNNLAFFFWSKYEIILLSSLLYELRITSACSFMSQMILSGWEQEQLCRNNSRSRDLQRHKGQPMFILAYKHFFVWRKQIFYSFLLYSYIVHSTHTTEASTHEKKYSLHFPSCSSFCPNGVPQPGHFRWRSSNFLWKHGERIYGLKPSATECLIERETRIYRTWVKLVFDFQRPLAISLLW
jgi:hypothetical protein